MSDTATPIPVFYRYTGSTYTARAGSGKTANAASSTSSAASACRRAAAKSFGFTKVECDFVTGRAADIILNPEPARYGYSGGHTFASVKEGAQS
jgi:hypothetical protein